MWLCLFLSSQACQLLEAGESFRIMRMLQSTQLIMSKAQSIQPHPLEMLQQVAEGVQLFFCLSCCMDTDMDMDTCAWTWTHQGCHGLGSASERDTMIDREGNVISMLIPMGSGVRGSGHMLHGKSGT